MGQHERRRPGPQLQEGHGEPQQDRAPPRYRVRQGRDPRGGVRRRGRLRLRNRTLPALRVRRGREEGQIEERRAALPLPGLRQDLRHGQRAHPGDEQAPEGDLDGLRRVLRAHAAPARMREALPRLPQDRLHHAPQADRVPLGLLPLVQGRAGLRLRARRDLFPRVVQVDWLH